MDLSSINELDIKKGGTTKFFGDDVINIFYRVLSNSNRWDLGLGYFSLSGFKELAWPLSKFILENQGSIRIYCNHALSEKDYNALSQSKQINFSQNPVFKDLHELYKALEGSDDQLFNDCISYLVNNELIQIKVLVKRHSQHGISHQKNSIFYDDKNNEVTLCGSGNESVTALRFNYEDVTASCSFWNERSANITIQETKDDFEANFNEGNAKWEILPISSKELKEKLDKIGFRPVDHVTLKKSSLKHSKAEVFSNDIEKEIAEEIFKCKKEMGIPQFPFPGGPRQYQLEAFSNWRNNDCKGVFAMATGTGKTYTSLYSVVRMYEKTGFYQLIILVPTIPLAKQWAEEVSLFNFSGVINTASENKNKWYESLRSVVRALKYNMDDSFVFITTYDTFSKPEIVNLLDQCPSASNMILIADEAHNIGTERRLKNLPKNIIQRIGLSATPKRQFDENGNVKINSFFDSFPPNYTFRYSMKKAIDNGVLAEFNYYPKFTYLQSEEIVVYREFTRKLRKYLDPDKGRYRDHPDATRLLIERKRVVHKAKNKLDILFPEIIRDIGLNNFKDAFIYAPEGKTVSYGEEFGESEKIYADDNLINNYAMKINELLGSRIRLRKFTGDNRSDRDQIIRDFEKNKLDVLIAMKCLDEGIDIPQAKLAIFCSSTGNPRQFVQRRGRVLRQYKNTTANIYDMVIVPDFDSVVDEAERKAEISIFRSELARIVNFVALAKNNSAILNEEIIPIMDKLNLDINVYELINKELS